MSGGYLEPQTNPFSQFLRLAFIRSPNYAAGVAGWTINQDGSAEFNNLTIRGTFKGTDFIINSSGAFFYNGAPAAGNLIASIASAAGTDAFGNTFPAGIFEQTSGGAGGAALLVGGQLLLDFATSPSVGVSPSIAQASDGGMTVTSAIPGLGRIPSRTAWYPNKTTLPADVARIGTDQLRAWDPVAGYPTLETWHTATLATGWTGSVRYKLAAADNQVHLEVNATFTDNGTTHLASGTAMLNPALPAAYHPANTSPEMAAGISGSGLAITASRVPCVHVGTGGQVFGDFVTTSALNNTATFQGEFSYPLD